MSSGGFVENRSHAPCVYTRVCVCTAAWRKHAGRVKERIPRPRHTFTLLLATTSRLRPRLEREGRSAYALAPGNRK